MEVITTEVALVFPSSFAMLTFLVDRQTLGPCCSEIASILIASKSFSSMELLMIADRFLISSPELTLRTGEWLLVPMRLQPVMLPGTDAFRCEVAVRTCTDKSDNFLH